MSRGPHGTARDARDEARGDAPAPLQLAEFATGDELRAAVERLRALGYRDVEAYSPYPVPGVAEALGRGRGGIPLVTLLGGLAGAAIGYGVQWYTQAWSYPLNIGGRPSNAVPAFIPATFEATVLCAALAAFLALLAGLRLPRLWHPELGVPGFERATVDRFWVRVGGRDRRAADVALTRRELEGLGAVRVVEVA
ncbi:MAG TPA: DUF3341 domain-containing protein [Gemmatimonadaceae bacterium]|nr:DUF3341 domain-containing protein [Gemmatimonadaceae bacterium]